ncbi:DUF6328 family protein [Agromyces ramosus]|uniref:Membrane protein YdbS with pleckstrin-like domain n=1 Tax=Agromyces ramosus TaxID=33879 RepID=A0ABU0R6X9_9MICO|nr:DUF6328 family protein [Agromyces ramosus]MDQ0893839.1 membrane protein YdbS with pleckstrin-like domain [Agromyces ramosus]
MITDPRFDPRPDGRNETRTERFDRNWSDILQELRAVQTGTQIISGFLLAAAFQPRFTDLDPYQLTLYLVLVVLAASATLLGLGPVILHRRLFGQLQKERIVRIGSGLLLADLVVVSLLAAGVTSLIFDVALGRIEGFIALGLTLLAVVVLWVIVPRTSAERD